MEKLWFKAKNYGWGWYPSSWQGWLVTLVFVAFMIWQGARLDALVKTSGDDSFVLPFFIKLIAATLILLLICYKTGEKPTWRWGK